MKPTEHLTITERPGTYIVVMSDSSGPIIVVRDGLAVATSRYTPEEAAKLGLAVLEAAGAHKDSQDFLGGAVEQLKFHIGEQERITAEARERAELEAEALELFNTQVRALGDGLEVDSLDDMHHIAKESWLAVARRARELAKEATK